MFRGLVERGWWAVLLLFVAAAGVLGPALPTLGIDASTNILLDEKDPDLAYYSRTRRLWPSDDEFAMVCCPRDDWFTREALADLRQIEKDLAAVPHVRKVFSLFSVPILRQGPFPRAADVKGVDLAKAKEELTTHAIARGTLISEDGKDAVLLAYLDAPAEYERLDRERNEAIVAGDDARVAATDAAYETARAELRVRRRAMVDGVRAVAAKWSEKLPSPVRLSGLPVINIGLVDYVKHDVDVFGIASFLLFTAAFAVIYRRVRWTAFPIVTCILPVVLVLGAMAWAGQKLTVITANLPLLLFVLMLPYTVYFVERYRERRAHDAAEDHATTTTRAAGDIWLACLYSCTTAMAGFASLLTSGVKPVWWFGLMMTIGLAVGLACVFLFLPAATVRLRAVRDPAATTESRTPRMVSLLEKSVLAAPAVLGLAGLALYVGGAWACTQLTVENKFIDYFRATSEISQGLEYIDRRMGGTTPLDIVLTSSEKGHFGTAQGLDEIRAASAHIAKVPEVGSVISLATLVDEARESPLFRTTPPERIVAMAEKNKDLEPLLHDVATVDLTTTRVLIRFRETSPTLNRKRILEDLRAELAARPELKDLAPRVTGVFLLYANMLESLLRSHTEAFWTVILAISLMLMTLFGFRRPVVQVPVAVALSVVLFFLPVAVRDAIGIAAAIAAVTCLVAALAMRLDERLERRGWRRAAAFVHSLALSVVVHVPEILPAVVVLGAMGVAGIPLDLITVTIAAIAMGVGIDAAIQYTVRFRVELAATNGDRRAAVTRSHATIGRSIWIATSIMVAGFIVLALSDFVPTIYFGVFNALAMVMGQFAALTVLPALFLLTGLPRR